MVRGEVNNIIATVHYTALSSSTGSVPLPPDDSVPVPQESSAPGPSESPHSPVLAFPESSVPPESLASPTHQHSPAVPLESPALPEPAALPELISVGPLEPLPVQPDERLRPCRTGTEGGVGV